MLPFVIGSSKGELKLILERRTEDLKRFREQHARNIKKEVIIPTLHNNLLYLFGKGETLDLAQYESIRMRLFILLDGGRRLPVLISIAEDLRVPLRWIRSGLRFYFLEGRDFLRRRLLVLCPHYSNYNQKDCNTKNSSFLIPFT